MYVFHASELTCRGTFIISKFCIIQMYKYKLSSSYFVAVSGQNSFKLVAESWIGFLDPRSQSNTSSTFTVSELNRTRCPNSYEMMCIEFTGECCFKDKFDDFTLEFELSTSLKASRNSLKSICPSLSISMLFAKSSMESSGMFEFVCSFNRRQHSSNSSIDTRPDNLDQKLTLHSKLNQAASY